MIRSEKMDKSKPHLVKTFKFEDTRGSLEKLIPTISYLNFDIKQIHIVRNTASGVIRGMHHQKYPFQDQKVVKVISGRIIDVCICVNPKNAKFGESIRFEMSADDGHYLYIPDDYAHGYQTLTENTSILYFHSNEYSPESDNSFNPNDPIVAHNWSNNPQKILSEKDKSLPYFAVAYGEA